MADMSVLFEFARRQGTTVLHRHEPASLSLTLNGLHTADHHTLGATFQSTVRLVERRADVLLFDEQLLGAKETVTLDDVRQLVLNPLRSTLETFAAQHDAAACLRQQATIETLLLQRCNAIGFGCGLEFSPPVELQLSSESLRASQLNAQVARERAEALDHAAQLAARLQQAGPAHGLPASEQAALLPLIMQQAAVTLVDVFVAAGDRLLCFDPATLTLESVTVPASIGLLRSVRRLRIDDTLRTAVGGQRGVWIAPTNDFAEAAYTQPAALARGMNSIAWQPASRELYASHGEVGLIAWSIDQPKAPRIIQTPPDARWVTTLDERLIFASGADLYACDGLHARLCERGTSSIVGLLPFEHEVWVVRDDGSVDTIDRGTLTRTGARRFSRAIEAAAAVTNAGLRAAVIAGDDGDLECVAAGGQVLARYPAALGAIRMLTLAAGRIVGVSNDRASLVVWDASNPAAEPKSINVLARTGHRIADLTAGL